MNRKLLKNLGLVVALAVLALGMGCHNTPTSSSEFELVISATLVNTKFQPTILEAQLIFDGGIVDDIPVTVPVATLQLSANGSASPGSHTLQVAIVNQTTTPNNYTVPVPTIAVYDLAGTSLKNIQLPTMSSSLATAGTITYTFSL